MSKLQLALELADLGYHVFPLEAGSKLPHIDAFPRRATRDKEQIRAWWSDPVLGVAQPYNIGISTTKYADTQALLVVDIDNKGGKYGDATILSLELEGFILPNTATARTPTGGRHFFYIVDSPLQQSAGKLGDGIDTRSNGGYVVAAGSDVSAGTYTWATDKRQPVSAPAWLVDRFRGKDNMVSGGFRLPDAEYIPVERQYAVDRAITYLGSLESATAGTRNTEGYKAAAVLKDLGVPQEVCAELLLRHWKCEPMMELHEIGQVVNSAYQYGLKEPGCRAPEKQFETVTKRKPLSATTDEKNHPFEELNKHFAFVLAGGGAHILWETQDAQGRERLEHLAIGAFHGKFASWSMQVGKKSEPVTDLWMKHPTRRSYDGLCFSPGLPSPARFYNTWRGFAVDPIKQDELVKPEWQRSVDYFLEHLQFNVCGGDTKLAKWLLGYFAHMVQRPWEKPLVALVFRGGKGVGKNALVERVGALLGGHFLLTANRRYLISQFNSHLEKCLFFVLDEAFWSGDKQAEGIIKDLITGTSHLIEHKGKEIFTIENRTRVAIIGNEDWLVPSSHDERRFAVFDVGEGRKQDRKFFTDMRVYMEQGGYRLLLKLLLETDISDLDINEAPHTQGLLDQKNESLEPFYQWWLDCLLEGKIIGGDFEIDWLSRVIRIRTDQLRNAYIRYSSARNIRSRMPDSRAFGKLIKRCAPVRRTKTSTSDNIYYEYVLPKLNECRIMWDRYIGHEVDWG